MSRSTREILQEALTLSELMLDHANWGMRNRIAHGYLLVEPAIIRRTLDADIPAIIEPVRRALTDG